MLIVDKLTRQQINSYEIFLFLLVKNGLTNTKEEPSMAKDISTKVHTKLEVMAQLRQRQELLKPLKYGAGLIIYLFTRKVG